MQDVDGARQGVAGETKRVAIVADGSLMSEAIMLGLRETDGFEVVARVDSGPTSLGVLRQARPDLVLIDDMDHADVALSIIRAIRAEDDAVLVILLTMRVGSGWLDEVFEAGATAVLSKNISPSSLVTILHETADGNVVYLHRRDRAHHDHGARGTSARGSVPFTARELEILRRIAAGHTNGDIADQLQIGEQTVKFHVTNIFRKLHVANRTQASHYAHVNGLLDSSDLALDDCSIASSAQLHGRTSR